jgi:hypothetical protein
MIDSAGFGTALHSTFRVTPMTVGGGAVTAVDMELVDYTEHQSEPGYESFTLLFQGATDPPLSQGLHHFEHASLGGTDIFIVPVSADAVGRGYEAIFSRATAPEEVTV